MTRTSIGMQIPTSSPPSAGSRTLSAPPSSSSTTPTSRCARSPPVLEQTALRFAPTSVAAGLDSGSFLVTAMDDLRERFAGLDDIRVPDLWTDVERRLAAYETNAVTRKLAPATGTRRSTPGGDTGSWGVGRRRTAALLAAAALIAALLIGALAAGSQLMRLTAVLPSTPLPS